MLGAVEEIRCSGLMMWLEMLRMYGCEEYALCSSHGMDTITAPQPHRTPPGPQPNESVPHVTVDVHLQVRAYIVYIVYLPMDVIRRARVKKRVHV